MTTVKKIGRAIEAILVVIAAVLAVWYFFLRSEKTVDMLDRYYLPDFGTQTFREAMTSFDPDGTWVVEPENYNEYKDEGFAIFTFTGTCDIMDVNGIVTEVPFSVDITMERSGEDTDYMEINNVTIDGTSVSNTSPFITDIVDVIYGNQPSTDMLILDDSNWLGLGAITFMRHGALEDNVLAVDGVPDDTPSDPTGIEPDPSLENTTWYAYINGKNCGIYLQEYDGNTGILSAMILVYDDGATPDQMDRIYLDAYATTSPFDLMFVANFDTEMSYGCAGEILEASISSDMSTLNATMYSDVCGIDAFNGEFTRAA